MKIRLLVLMFVMALAALIIQLRFFGFPASKPIFRENKSAPAVAILESDNTIQKTPNPIFYRWEMQGAFKTLQRLQVAYTVLHDEDIHLDQLKNFQLLILPNSKNMSRDEAAEIQKFVQNGGKLFAIEFTSYRDEQDEPANNQNNFQLSALFGADFVSVNSTPPQAGGLEMDSRLRPSGTGFAALRNDRMFVPLGRNHAVYIEPHAGSEILARWLNDNRKTLSQPENLNAAILENSSHNVIYSGENLFAPENSNSLQVQKIIASLLNLLIANVATMPTQTSTAFPTLPPFGLLTNTQNFTQTVSISLPILPPQGKIGPLTSNAVTHNQSGPFPPLNGYITSEGYFKVFSDFRGGFLTEPPNAMIAFQSAPGGFLVAGRSGRRFSFKPETPYHPLELVLWHDSKIPEAAFKFGAFRGELILADSGKQKEIINQLPLETYLADVVPHEMPFYFQPEALKAMAVIARTFALKAGNNLCATVRCQAYDGLEYEASSAKQAVEKTQGEVLSFQNRLADVPYHSTCGGVTEDVQNVWHGASLPYLQAVVDSSKPLTNDLSTDSGVAQFLTAPQASFCEASSRYRWQKYYTQENLQSIFLKSLPILLKQAVSFKKIMAVQVTGRTPHGRVTSLKITTDNGDYQVDADAVRWLFGDGQPGLGGLPSTLFVIQNNLETGILKSITIVGGGWGHGLGLCQFGAEGMAEQNYTYLQILQHYYPGSRTLQVRDLLHR